jgi:hypothetical protein
MGNAALITDAGVATVAAGPTLTAVVAGQGMTFSVRNSALTDQVLLADTWRKGTHVGRVQLSSSDLMPVANGIRINTPAGLADRLLPKGAYTALTPQDTILVQDIGTAADVDLVAMQSYYTNLPAGGMVLKNPGDIVNNNNYVLGWPVAVTSSATAGNQGTALVTATIDNSEANAWYAVLGIETDVSIGVVGILGVDTSQLLCGLPGNIDAFKQRSAFMDKSVEMGLPCIPCFNSANKAGTFVAAIDNAASTAINATMILARMPNNWTP